MQRMKVPLSKVAAAWLFISTSLLATVVSPASLADNSERIPPHPTYRPKVKHNPDYYNGARGATTPPYEGTVFISPNVLTSSDPTVFDSGSVTYLDTGCREVYYEPDAAWRYLSGMSVFEVRFRDGTRTEAWVDPQYTREEARAQIDKMFPSFGRIPYFLRTGVSVIAILKDGTGWNAGSNVITVHDETFEEDDSGGYAEEGWLHESAHLSVDDSAYGTSEWDTAVGADSGRYISTYARDYPDREDVAESMSAWFPFRHLPSRIESDDADLIEATIPNRLDYFDDRDWSGSDLYPVSGSNPSVADGDGDWIRPPDWMYECPARPNPDYACSEISTKNGCIEKVGCSWFRKSKKQGWKCGIAKRGIDCSQHKKKGWKCKQQGCLWNKGATQKKKCQGRWDSYCSDKKKKCSGWAAMGDCSSDDSDFMLDKCKASCHGYSDCPSFYVAQCRDKHKNCDNWASDGECVNNPGYMLQKCARSCNDCPIP